MNFYDAHNHLQDDRFAGGQDGLLREAAQAGVVRMVVNGSGVDDWPAVAALAARSALVQASYGVHPWYHHQQPPGWREDLVARLVGDPAAAVGEIGLDRWKGDLPYEGQEEVFLDQWSMARAFNRPASIHCLKAWGRLLDLLREHPGPACGFVLHSYGGPAEMVAELAGLGAYFSFPGYFAHARKEKQRATFLLVPPDRLLVETDAPDQLLPDERNRFPRQDAAGRPINHPANLPAVYAALAETRGISIETLASQVERNFLSLFGKG